MAEENVIEGNKKMALEAQGKTLFVRNLPYTATDKELEEAFSEFGPIKRSFVVKDKDSSKLCRGFGYVAFVSPDDAAKALQAGTSINRRKAILSFANKKPRKRDNYKSKTTQSSGAAAKASEESETDLSQIDEKDNKFSRSQKPNDSSDEAKRTIVISGLPSTTTKSKLKLLCCKFGKVEKIEFPAPSRGSTTSFVIFKSIKGAVRSFQKLNRSSFESTVISACLLTKEGRLPKKKDENKSKLIVRNIAFKCNEKELKSMFEKFGELVGIDLPSKIDDKGRKRMRGFAFVQFTHREQATNAMKELNKTMVHGRPIIIDWAVPKDEFVSRNDEDKSKEETKEEEITSKALKISSSKTTRTEGKEESEDGESKPERDEHVDNNLGQKHDQTEPNLVDNSDEEEGTDDSDEEDSSDILSDEDMERKVSEGTKKQSHDVKEGRTIFIRNLPFEASEEELSDLFSRYGQIFYCKIVVDQQTGHSKGSAFIKFKDPAVIDKVIADAENPDPRTGGIIMEGRRLVVMKAVTRGKVMEFEKQRKDSKKEPKDKRNLSLAQEGVIFRNSEAAKELSEADMKKREKAWAEKKAKLKNQNYFISKTRLCIRNLPLTVGEQELRVVVTNAVKEKHDMRQEKVKKTRIMRSRERVDKSGKGRSLGYAFIEFDSHDCALTALRALNNNPDVFGDARRPIVEFSVENKVALELQERRREKRATKSANANLQNDKIGKGGSGKREEERKGNRMGRNEKRRVFGKKKGKDKIEKRESAVLQNETKTKSKKGGSHIQEEKGGSHNRRKWSKKDTGEKLESSKQISRYHSDHVNPSPRKPQNATRKRKKDFEAEEQMKAPAKKKMKKAGRSDKEEDKFNLLVNKYKTKLFANDGSRGKNEKRWFE